MKHRLESERWKILVKQRRVIDEYSRIIEELRASDMQFRRLDGEFPDAHVCPDCHYRLGAVVELRVVEDHDRAEVGIMQCPKCELIVPPN